MQKAHNLPLARRVVGFFICGAGRRSRTTRGCDTGYVTARRAVIGVCAAVRAQQCRIARRE
jgi:hypothetical protein